jgi:hypothetical protein
VKDVTFKKISVRYFYLIYSPLIYKKSINKKIMKIKLLNTLTAGILFLIPNANFGQTINLGTVSNFVLFTTNGAMSNTGVSQLTGNVGTNSGLNSGFGNVNGSMHQNDGVSAQCTADLLIAYNQLNNAIPTLFPAPLLGNGQVLTAGVYSISSSATLNLDLTLDALGNSSAVFIFQIQGALSTNASSKIKLVNGAKACNVFWKVEGLVNMAPGTTMKGTVVANNAAINMSIGDTLEGRAVSTNGAITINGVLGNTPIGCGSPILNGPAAPNLASTACYAIFSSDGSVTNTSTTTVIGDIGTNVGLTTGFNALNVTGTIHPIPDVSTALCKADLGNMYTYLNGLPNDIELLYPAQFGNNLVLTPHTYLMNAATVFTDTLYLDAQGNINAVFVIQINGALSTSTNSKVKLINGTQAKNVFWKVDGAVNINKYSIFKGTIVCNNGAVDLKKGAKIDGRVFTTTGTLVTDSVVVNIPTSCVTTGVVNSSIKNNIVFLYPNPFVESINISLNDLSQINKVELKIYNTLGKTVSSTILTKEITTIETSNLSSGIYFYKLFYKNTIIQSGKLISAQ